MFPVTFPLVFRADVTQQECDRRTLKHASIPKKQTPPNIGLLSQTVIPTPKPIHAINQGYNKSDNPAGKRRRASEIILSQSFTQKCQQRQPARALKLEIKTTLSNLNKSHIFTRLIMFLRTLTSYLMKCISPIWMRAVLWSLVAPKVSQTFLVFVYVS